MLRTGVFLACVLFVFTRCTHLAVTPEPQPAVGQKEFWSNQTQREERFQSITGKAWIKYQTKGVRLVGKGNFTIALPSQGRWELRDPIGRVAYLAALNGGKLLVFQPGKQVANQDNASGRQFIRHWLGVEASFADVQRCLLGLLPGEWKKNAFKDWAWDGEKKAYLGTMAIEDGELAVWVNYPGLEIQEMVLTTKTQTARWEYADYTACCDRSANKLQFPYIARMRLEKGGGGIEFEWERLSHFQPEAGSKPFDIELPQGTVTKNFNE